LIVGIVLAVIDVDGSVVACHCSQPFARISAVSQSFVSSDV
jgi:hypothetical protein